MCRSDESIAIEILMSEFLLAMEIMMKHCREVCFIGTHCTYAKHRKKNCNKGIWFGSQVFCNCSIKCL